MTSFFESSQDTETNKIQISSETYTKEILCDNTDLIKMLQEAKTLNPKERIENYVLKCDNNIKYIIGRKIGKGAFNDVYELLNDKDKVIRITRDKATEKDNDEYDEDDEDDEEDEIYDEEYEEKLLQNEKSGLFIQHYISSKYPGCKNVCKVFEFGILKKETTTNLNEEPTNARPKYRVYAIIEKLKVPDLYSIVKRTSKTIIRDNEKYDFRKLIKQALEGLNCMNEKKFVHLDIKLENIGIDKDGNAKLIDFGLARYLDKDGEPVPYAKGTPKYIDPFMIDGKRIYFNSDIYAFGNALFEIYFKAEETNGGLYYIPPVSTYPNNYFNHIRRVLDDKCMYNNECKYIKNLKNENDYIDLRELIKKMMDHRPTVRIKINDVLKDKWINADNNGYRYGGSKTRRSRNKKNSKKNTKKLSVKIRKTTKKNNTKRKIGKTKKT
jgi:serine/threonine protein kinase